MSDTENPPAAEQEEGETRLHHRRSHHYIEEIADKFSLVTLQSGKEARVHIQFGRDSVFIGGETTSDFVDEDGGTRRRVSADNVDMYRLDVAGLSLPLETVRELHGVLGDILRREDGDE